MKMISDCPCCGKPLLNEAMPTIGRALWRKTCEKTLTHKIIIKSVPGDDDQIMTLTLRIKPGLLVTWNFQDELCWLSSTMDLELKQYLPFFKPDLSDYDKLIDKVKIYILFS